MRNTKTEFVSCPSCGRTLFDLQETTAKITEATGHLPGVTIAVMGCIVNGELSATVAACAIKFAALLNGIDLSVNYMAKMN